MIDRTIPCYMEKYWLWKRLNWHGHSYRWFFLGSMVSEDEIPEWVIKKFDELSDHNIGLDENISV
jgi:hypothetical protein